MVRAEYPHPRVEIIRLDRCGGVIRRHDCVHRHRLVRAAEKCAKESARGLPAGGGEVLAMVYDEHGEAVSQARVFGKTTRGGWGWKAETRLVAPGSEEWREVPRV